MIYRLITLLLCASFVTSTAFAQESDLKTQAIQTYADIVYASYSDSLSLTQNLKTAIDAFLADPSEESLNAAKNAWLVARDAYGQTEAFRFYGGPIDDADGPEGLINAWPLDEAYIDYVAEDASTGIINNPDTYPTIDRDLLISLNESGAEENISTGYHAIEFLLWGQDLSAESAGNRPYTDYTTAPNAERRATYLSTVTDLLVDDLQSLVDAWTPDTNGNYRDTFLALESDVALQNILTGIGVLAKSELAGERIFTAFDNQDQEDEHSCFSDNTHNDIIANFSGIQNVYLGTYVRADGSVVEGVGLDEVVASVNADLNDEVVALLTQADAEAHAVPAPFDQAIIDAQSRPQVFTLVNTLLDLGDKLAETGSTLGVAINTALPE